MNPDQQPAVANTPKPQKHDATKTLKSFASVALFIIGVVIAATLINRFIFQSYYVDGTSMTPTLQNDDRLIIDKLGKTFANVQGKPYIPERGSIVVLDSSIVDQSGHHEQLIKRIMGLPGETVIVKDGVITIKNSTHPEGFTPDTNLNLTLDPTYVAQPLEVTLDQNQVFVVGDNRAPGGSYDSRIFGPVEASQIEGRLWARIFPFNKAQAF